MSENIHISINADALHTKSKIYIGRALARKGDGDLDQYQLLASVALELLGKAALARRHPCLVVDPNHWKSMFVAAGINITTDVKTITAKTLYNRLHNLIPTRFDMAIQEFCQEIAERRNTELHSGDLPFQAMRLGAWEERYWYACDMILHEMDSSLEKWLGATDAKAPRRLLSEAVKALESAVSFRVEEAKKKFEMLPKKERENLIIKAELQGPKFKKIYEKTWIQNCPACNCRAFMTGEQTGEIISEERGDHSFYIWEIVDREFLGEEFYCPTCGLILTGNREIKSSGINYIHEDQHERELGYEPDYGND